MVATYFLHSIVVNFNCLFISEVFTEHMMNYATTLALVHNSMLRIVYNCNKKVVQKCAMHKSNKH